MEEGSSTFIRLVSRDDERLEVPLHVAKLSQLVTNAIDDDSDDSDDSDMSSSSRIITIPIPNVNSSTLRKVIEYCTHHQTVEAMTPIATPLKSCKLEELVQAWYVQFCTDAIPGTGTGTSHDDDDDESSHKSDDATSGLTTTTTTSHNQNHNLLFELVSAANYMDIKPLLDLTCLAVSVWIKGKSASEIKKIFHLSDGDDVSERERERRQIEEEMGWCDKPKSSST